MDAAHDVDWIGGVVDAKQVSEGPLAQGTRVARIAKFLGRRIEYVNEVSDYEPPSRLVMKSVQGPFPMRITYAFAEANGGGTRASIRVEGEASGFFRLASPVLAATVRRNLRRDLGNLKRTMEAGA
jgi:hypothetical protein